MVDAGGVVSDQHLPTAASTPVDTGLGCLGLVLARYPEKRLIPIGRAVNI
jgi:hypothetical protein